jgi:hypothetical protein
MSAQDRTSRLTTEHFVHNGCAPAPLFGVQMTPHQQAEYLMQFVPISSNNNNNNQKKLQLQQQQSSTTSMMMMSSSLSKISADGNLNHLIKWRLPAKCVGASSRMTIAAPLFVRALWQTREFGSVSNAPTPFADSYATALLPPDVSTLATSIAPTAEQNFEKLRYASLERAVIGNWESFTTGEIQALFQKISAAKSSSSFTNGDDNVAVSEAAKMEQWEKNLARKVPFFACAVEAIASNKQNRDSRSAIRMSRALDITNQSRRGLLDALSLAHQGEMRRIDRSRKKLKAELDLEGVQ